MASGATAAPSLAGRLSTDGDVEGASGSDGARLVKEAYGRLPVGFEENTGQLDGKVKYSARGSGFQLFLTADEAVLTLRKPPAEDSRDGDSQVVQDETTEAKRPAIGSVAALRMKLIGANRRARVKGEDRLAAKSNYFIGAEPKGWKTGVEMFERVRYANVYPGVDVVYYGNQRQLEYDFVVAPHVNPARIKFKFSGARELHLDGEGHLLLQTEGGLVRQEKPAIYQLVEGKRQEIAGGYAVRESGEIGFHLGEYDRSLPLVIDPVLSYSTYLGGIGADQALAIALDGAGNAYLTGQTSSPDFPTVNPVRATKGEATDAFVLKVNPGGTSLVYATYLGGDGSDTGSSIAVDAAGNAYVTGTTGSGGFPRTFGTLQESKGGGIDAFVTKLNASGDALVYSSFLGGENADQGYAIAVNAAGNAYVAGRTDSTTFLGGVPMPKQGSALYKSSDAGATWSASNNGLTDPNVASLTVDPANADTLYAAGASGVFKSTDAGNLWRLTGQARTSTAPLAPTSVAVDRLNPATIYASTFSGVYKSTNGGDLWDLSSNGLGGIGGFVYHVTVDPNNSATLYASTFNSIYKSTNAGASWTRMASGIASISFQTNRIVFDPTDTNILYAATVRGIFKSTNGAASWTNASNGLVSTPGATPSVTSIVFDPASPATVYAGTSIGVFKSTDSGLNWTASSDGLRAPLPNGGTYIPPITSVVISPSVSGTLYAASSQGGVYKSIDGGANWAASAQGLANFNVTNLAISHASPSNIYASTNSGSDAFVARINTDGTHPEYLRYLGGSEFDTARGIAIDTDGNAYLTGTTNSFNFPTLNPAQAAGGGVVSDAFITKLDTEGALLYSTYLGGNGSEQGLGIAVGATGNAHVTGSTTSTNFPIAGSRPTASTFGTEVFVSKLSASGSSLDYSVYHGGSSTDQGSAIALDAAGNAYVTGATSSSDFPIVNGAQTTSGGGNDAFVLKLSPNSAVVYSTYLGGGGPDQGFGIAVDASGAAHVAGATSSFNFPTVSPLQTVNRGSEDAFLARIASSVDLALTMTDAPDPVVLGSNLTYTIKVTNVGELTASGVRLSDTLHAGSTLVSASATSGTCTGSSSTVNCELGTLASGASATVTIVIAPPAVQTITNMAGVTTLEPEVNTANNTASENTQVSFADLKVTKITPHDLVRPGDKIVYVVNVTNLGGTTTGAVTLTDNLPAGVTFISCNAPGRAVCGGTGNNRTATIPSLAVGASESIVLTVAVDASAASGTAIGNTATASSDIPDPDASNNQATVTSNVTDILVRPRLNGKIAYATDSAPTLAVKTINADGSGKTLLTDGQSYARRPAWSPDGSKVAFCATNYSSNSPGAEVRVVNADGTGLKTVSRMRSNETNITWSPSGNQLAFVGADNSIYVAQADGTATTKLINDSTFINRLDWSPDGQRFAYVRGGALYLMDVDGGNRRKLTNDPVNITYAPSWSPDGSKILFLREHTAYIINADGTEETKLFNHPTSEATWSPDGTKIVFTFQGSIATINLDGTNQTTIANDSSSGTTFYNFEPDWQPLPNASPTPTPTPTTTYSISGQVSRGAFPNAFLQVALSGTINAVTGIDANGNYSFVRLPAGGNYTVTPASNFFNFNPAARTFDNLNANQTGVNFAISGAINYSISGRVTDQSGAPLSNIEVTLGREGFLQGTVRTGTDGAYAFNNLSYGRNHTVYVSPSSRTDYEFEPDARTFTLNQSQIVNFVGTSRNSFQFQTDGFIPFGEGDGRATVVVTRAGIPSMINTPASVTLRTHDDPAAVPCDPTIKKPDGTDYPKGAAYARCDYATTVETLHFAPGERQKTFTIPIIDDAHVEGTEFVAVRLSDAAGASIGRLNSANVLIHDNDSGAAENPTRTTSFFVRQHYLDFLSREPEPEEPWSAVLDKCPDVNNNPLCDRITVSQSFFGSPEFRLKGFFVFNFYRVAFGRLPEYAEIIPDMSAVSGQTAAQVYANRADFAFRFTARPEFKALYDHLSPTDFVDELLRRYNRPPQIITPDPHDPESGRKVLLTRSDLITRLGAGGALGLTRAQVLRAVVESDEVAAAEYNGAFVAMQYYGYLRRTPEEDGYQAWLKVINEDPQNVRLMVNGFMNSTEYRLRFGKP